MGGFTVLRKMENIQFDVFRQNRRERLDVSTASYSFKNCHVNFAKLQSALLQLTTVQLQFQAKYKQITFSAKIMFKTAGFSYKLLVYIGICILFFFQKKNANAIASLSPECVQDYMMFLSHCMRLNSGRKLIVNLANKIKLCFLQSVPA